MKAIINKTNTPIFLTPEDTFGFNCKKCGKCCRNREDVLLTGPDIYRASKYLGISSKQFINDYCELYIGDTSRIPICRLKPQGEDRHCPLLSDGRCRVHDVKPTVCALYPLARMWDENGKAKYYVNSTSGHDTKDRHKVSDWLRYGGLPTEDEPGRLWNSVLVFCIKFMRENEKKMSPGVLKEIHAIMTGLMYGCLLHEIPIDELMRAHYDTIKDSLPRCLECLTF